jgi:hypothetical protein
MPTTKPEPTIDVERSAVLRLKEHGQRRHQQVAGIALGYWEMYWRGYMRALEDVLAMENE